MKKICFCMIVKNESAVIRRVLESVKPILSSWVIVDTGSEDNTGDIILETLEGTDGHFVMHPWQGFGHARSLGLEIAHEYYPDSFALILDADEVLQGDPRLVEGEADAFGIMMKSGNIHFKQLRMFKLSRPWQYVGVLHEFPTSPGSWSEAMTDAFHIGTSQDGARSRNPSKYMDDAKLLLEAMKDPTTDPHLLPRYQFYYAQSLRDAGDHRGAAEAYEKRAKMGSGSNFEEVYVSLLEAGRAYCRLGEGDRGLRLFYQAYWTYPARVEACKELASMFAYRVQTNPRQGTLFVEP